jgi:hypothetical protein
MIRRKSISKITSHVRRVSAGGGIGRSRSASATPVPGAGPDARAQSGGLGRQGGGAMQLGPAPGFHSKHQRYISKDGDLLKMLENAVAKGGDAGTYAISNSDLSSLPDHFP